LHEVVNVGSAWTFNNQQNCLFRFNNRISKINNFNIPRYNLIFFVSDTNTISIVPLFAYFPLNSIVLSPMADWQTSHFSII